MNYDESIVHVVSLLMILLIFVLRDTTVMIIYNELIEVISFLTRRSLMHLTDCDSITPRQIDFQLFFIKGELCASVVRYK